MAVVYVRVCYKCVCIYIYVCILCVHTFMLWEMMTYIHVMGNDDIHSCYGK